jgi:hypothetical protein
MKKKNTIFCDIDGTLFKYRKFETYKTSEPELLPGVKDKLVQWCNEGHMIILTTARPECLREHTEAELAIHALPYRELIMGIERGPRFLINDMDPGKPGQRATGINLTRDQGLGSHEWNYDEM